PNNASGAVIVSVAPNSFADQAGLQPGDLLVSVGSKAVTSPDDAVTAIDAARKAGAKAIALRIIRQGESLFVGIDLTKHSQG
ncbi:MAG TPA: PDZ domain-containing protein, partial [Acidocella sp.]|uniref:PDZ domain-containing protein n=1 Tax=Acidocella sp. TaxID=50710 RepID=UPI002C793888